MQSSRYVNDWDERTQRIIGFFVGKGLLAATDIRPCPSVKLDLSEVIEVGLQVEQRILEVLPAALLRFPRSFLHQEKAPAVLSTILDCLRQNAEHGPDLGGIPYRDLKRWADYQLPDRRTLPVRDRRVMRSFRLKPSTITEIKRRAAERKQSESAVIEEALSKRL